MRRILLILITATLAAAGGCRMCADPYDYCGPTYVGECGSVCCDPDARAGSVLSRPLDLTAVSDMVVQGPVASSGETLLEPISQGAEMVAPAETSRLTPLPAPPSRSVRASGPAFLR